MGFYDGAGKKEVVRAASSLPRKKLKSGARTDRAGALARCTEGRGVESTRKCHTLGCKRERQKKMQQAVLADIRGCRCSGGAAVY